MEFVIGATTYRSSKLNAFTQLHMVRRLTPCVAGMASVVGQGIDTDNDIAAILTTLSGAITVLKDEDVEYVLNACLDVTERKQPGGGWAGLRVNNVTMFDGLTLPVMLQIAWHVVQDNLEDFSDALPSLSILMEKGKELRGRVFQAAKTGS